MNRSTDVNRLRMRAHAVAIGLAITLAASLMSCRLPTPDLTQGDATSDRDPAMPDMGMGVDASAPDAAAPDEDAPDPPPPPACVCGEHEVCVVDRCVPARFAPRSPTASTYVTSARPWLRWGLPEGVDGARVELCADRSCARVSATWDATGAAMRIPEALAPGVYFWRLSARHGGVFDAPGPVWEFVVPTLDPFSEERRRVAFLDLDGDGVEESITLSAEATETGSRRDLVVRFSGATPMQRIPIGTSTRDHNLSDVLWRAAGDLDGDGIGDLIVVVTWFHPWFNARGAARKESPFTYEVRAYRGGALPLSETPFGVRAPSTQTAIASGSSAWPLRDVDGDGTGDVMTTQRGAQPSPRGGSISSLQELAVSGGSHIEFADGRICNFSQTLTSGDFDGDGRAELIVTHCTPYEQRGRVFGVRVGAPTAPDRPVGPCPALGRPGPDTTETLTVLDADDDGYDDLVVGEPGRAVAPVVYYGGAGGLTDARCGEYGVERPDAGTSDASRADASDASTTDAPPWSLAERHSVSAGFEHLCALDARGGVWCWGYGTEGEIGDGARSTRTTPTRLPDLAPATSIWAGERSTCAILRDDTVWCWGANFTSTASPREIWLRPQRVPGFEGARSLFFGYPSALCALMRDGSVLCMGNVSGILGFPERYPVVTTPTLVRSLGDVRAIDGTQFVALLLHGDGSSEFFIGADTAPAQRIAIAPPGSGATVAAGSGWGVIAHPDGTAMLVGYDLLGDPRDRGNGPRPLPGADGVIAVSAGERHGAALRRDGTVLRWGDLSEPYMSRMLQRATPITGLRDIVEVTAGGRAGCARNASGMLYCWNQVGGLSGDGTYDSHFDPVPVSL